MKEATFWQSLEVYSITGMYFLTYSMRNIRNQQSHTANRKTTLLLQDYILRPFWPSTRMHVWMTWRNGSNLAYIKLHLTFSLTRAMLCSKLRFKDLGSWMAGYGKLKKKASFLLQNCIFASQKVFIHQLFCATWFSVRLLFPVVALSSVSHHWRYGLSDPKIVGSLSTNL